MMDRACSPRKGSYRRLFAWGPLLLVVLSAWLVLPAHAGEIELAWDDVPATDLAGYRVYYGTSADRLDQTEWAGDQTRYSLSVGDCQVWHVGVKAVDEGDLESPGFQRLVRGYPRPQIGTVSPEEVPPGMTETLIVRGANFDPGNPSDPSHPSAVASSTTSGVEVLSTDVVSCTELRVEVRIEEWVPEGEAELTVENPDLTHGDPVGKPWVFGRKSAAFRIKAAPDDPLSVTGTAPEPGTDNVPANVLPRVIFSNPLDPATVSAATVRLVDADGAPVSGSPSVEGSAVTVTPARPLAEGETYRLAVTGGAGGVADRNGNTLPEDYVQPAGFTIMEDPRSDEANGPRVRAADPEAGALDVPPDISEVRITFDRDVSGLAQVLSREELQRRLQVRGERGAVTQTPGSPEFRHGGQEVAILLAEPLLESRTYTTVVHLADDGLHRRLEDAGHGDLAMGSVWKSAPPWRTEGPLEDVSWVDPADTSAATHSLPLAARLRSDNTGVPDRAEFRLRFSSPVAPESLDPQVFRIDIQRGRSQRPVELEQPIETLEGGRVVVLDPAEPMPSGVRGRVRVFTGPSGVELIGPDGRFTIPSGFPMTARFATAVSAEPSAWTFGEAGSPAPQRGQLELGWAEPTDDVTAGFEVEVLDAEERPIRVLDAGPATELQVTGLADGREYHFRLRPYDMWGHAAEEPGRTFAAMPAPRVTEVDGEVTPGDESLVSVRGANFMDGARVVSRRDGLSFGRATVIRQDLIVVPAVTAEAAPVTPEDLTVVNPTPKSTVYFHEHPEAADVDGSGQLDARDAQFLRDRVGMTRDDPRYRPAVDPNGDGVVDGIDVGLIEDQLGTEPEDDRPGRSRRR